MSFLPAVEALNILVWVLSFFSLVDFQLVALFTLLALALLAILLVKSSNAHWLCGRHHRCSREHVADLFAGRQVRVESSGVHHEVVQHVRVFDPSVHECGWCSCAERVLLMAYDKICNSTDT